MILYAIMMAFCWGITGILIVFIARHEWYSEGFMILAFLTLLPLVAVGLVWTIMLLINRPLDPVSGPDRPACENLIEEVDVTPEMIDAARSALERYYIGEGIYTLSDECIKEVYRAVAQATTQPQPREEPHA